MAIKLRTEGKITISDKPYEESDKLEIDRLLVQGVIELIQYNPAIYGDIRIWNIHMIWEIKNKTIKPYKKSQLVVQDYSDEGKKEILIQTSTIHKMSQRLILVLGPNLQPW